MTSLRFPVPYRPEGPNQKYRLGGAVVEVPDVTSSEAPVVIRMDSLSEHFRTVPFVLYGGKLWEPLVNRYDDPPIGSGLFTDGRAAVSHSRTTYISAFVGRIPLMSGVDLSYTQTGWHNLPADGDDMSDAFVGSRTWDAISKADIRAIMVDDLLFRESPGPIYKIPGYGGDYAEREWTFGGTLEMRQALEYYPFDKAHVADAVSMERYGTLHPLRRAYAAPEFLVPFDRLPTWDGVSAALEAASAQAIASTNLFPRSILSNASIDALIELRSALASQFEGGIDTASRGYYTLPKGCKPWTRPDATHLLGPLQRYVDSDPMIRKRVATEFNTLLQRLRHEMRHLEDINRDIPDPDLANLSI